MLRHVSTILIGGFHILENLSTYKQIDIYTDGLPILITKCIYKETGPIMNFHWHNHIQFYYFKSGKGEIHLQNKTIPGSANDIILINNNEMHYLNNLCNNLQIFIVRIDFSALNTYDNDACQIKYISPINHNMVQFANQINDPIALDCIKNLIAEYDQKKEAYELVFKGNAYLLLSILYRKFCYKTLSLKESTEKTRRLKEFQEVFAFIETHYNEQITLEQLAEMLHISRHHFCRLFKSLTGRSAIDYINRIRIEKACLLLEQGRLNVTEVAISTGFDSVNYFSRLFKFYKNLSPSQVLKGPISS